MKNLDLIGVQELDAKEIMETDGGHMVGYSKWYHEQQAQAEFDFWLGVLAGTWLSW